MCDASRTYFNKHSIDKDDKMQRRSKSMPAKGKKEENGQAKKNGGKWLIKNTFLEWTEGADTRGGQEQTSYVGNPMICSHYWQFFPVVWGRY